MLINLFSRYLLSVYCVSATVLALEVKKRFLKIPHLHVHSNRAVVVGSRAWSFVCVSGGNLDWSLLEKNLEGHILGHPYGLASRGSVLSVVEPLLLLGWAVGPEQGITFWLMMGLGN